MASETYDYEPFGNTEHSMKQIADAIRHKGYGKDVREAIAQGMESYDRVSGELFDRMRKVEEKTDQEIKNRKDTDSHLQYKIDKLSERVGALESQVQQLQENDKDHEKRLKRIEELLFGSQLINASTVMVDDDSEHQGYDVADAPDYDYQEQEIN